MPPAHASKRRSGLGEYRDRLGRKGQRSARVGRGFSGRDCAGGRLARSERVVRRLELAGFALIYYLAFRGIPVTPVDRALRG